MNSDETAQKLGDGRLGWARGERVSDRYGSIGLFDEEGDARTFSPRQTRLKGARGELRGVVLEAGTSEHCDLARGLRSPKDPLPVGSERSLGRGTLFFCDDDAYVGLAPDDGRDHDWLDPEALYELREARIELFFVPDPPGKARGGSQDARSPTSTTEGET